jgi:hypothetical protein
LAGVLRRSPKGEGGWFAGGGLADCRPERLWGMKLGRFEIEIGIAIGIDILRIDFSSTNPGVRCPRQAQRRAHPLSME